MKKKNRIKQLVKLYLFLLWNKIFLLSSSMMDIDEQIENAQAHDTESLDQEGSNMSMPIEIGGRLVLVVILSSV